MALNYIWIGFFVLAFLFAIIRVCAYYFHDFFYGILGLIYSVGEADREVFSAMVDSTFYWAEKSVTIAIYLIGVMALWLGIMKIGEKGGAVDKIAWLFRPFMKRVFPGIPDKHPAMGAVLMNFCANMLGLDNAATPFGIKAMQELQSFNKQKDTASDSMIMFIVLNTSSLTLIPIAVLAYRASAGAANPTDVFVPIMLTTFFSSLAGLISVSIVQRINLFRPVVMAYLLGMSAFVGGILYLARNMPSDKLDQLTSFTGDFILYGIIMFFILLALRKKVNLYESFIEGAKEGFGVAIKIIPYLVAMLVGIGVFRASGGLDFLEKGLESFFSFLGVNTDFVPALPTGLMKPLSGSGARGMMLESFDQYGVDSFVGRLASTFQGSTETTFYTIAVYFGAVGIRKTRYAVTCGLIADFTAIVAGIFVAYLFFH